MFHDALHKSKDQIEVYLSHRRRITLKKLSIALHINILDGYPGMNFAHHCSYAPDPQNPDLFECATIGGGIRDCQKLGRKMLISLGGDTCDGSLGTTENAKKLAYYIWNLFLGGKDMQDKRPFLW